jgi:signal-transduction protein with cAMP-binding, CBS, and nucleotidyltransferase domain
MNWKGGSGSMLTVKQLLQLKRDESTYSVSPQASVYDALKLMAEKNVGAVMVVDENNQMIGIFTERDYARKIVLKGKTSLETPIYEIMTSEMITVNPEQTLEECMNLMTKWHIRHLPIMENGRLSGMVSMRDVVEVLLSTKEGTIASLENYILGEGYGK